jgi:hypothetical protein
LYPNQPRSQEGWPDQPSQYSESPRASRRAARYDRPPRRRRRRGWIALLVTLIVLAVILFVGDNVARSYAQNMIASKIETSDGLTQKPSVTIQGFPFLTQLAARDLKVVDVSASNVQAGKIDITSIKATATGVHLNSGFSSATVANINGTAFISFASVEKALGVQGVATITADPAAGPNAVKLSAGAIGSITGKVEVTGPNEVQIQMGSLTGLAALLGGVAPIPNQTIQIPKLPAGLEVHSVAVTSQGVVATASAQNTTLSQ